MKTLAIVRKLLRPAPAPIEIATRLGTAKRMHDDATLSRRRQAIPDNGMVSVAN